MNIAFFITPKKEVVYEKPSSTMRQALERMERYRYTAIPLVDEKGRYVGTVTEGDLLWKLKNTADLNFKNTEKILLKDVPTHMKNKPVHIDAEIEDLISISVSQNFIPVIDDNDIFIGIIKRSDIINYCYKLMYDRVIPKEIENVYNYS
ncbi:CBS domain-containing protein [Clostridium sp. MB40-C1]|uniref:CBS domain-containing protein n=1 Tax=Clostridium sp. MB40-C1 TaxID=3070996 RepID=UPI0027E0E831|nr:CBS domain-containing protein [Clostridium sp. MB40-C1]WMJ79164.1 CBS domain-containing protein [Clostridium sp. MB40-C1]